jgi:hypothetical protein
MTIPSRSTDRHDPFWDMDGKGARRVRLQRRLMRSAMLLLALVAVAVLVSHIPTIDPEFLVSGGGRPILAGMLLALLGTSILIALSRMRHTPDR